MKIGRCKGKRYKSRNKIQKITSPRSFSQKWKIPFVELEKRSFKLSSMLQHFSILCCSTSHFCCGANFEFIKVECVCVVHGHQNKILQSFCCYDMSARLTIFNRLIKHEFRHPGMFWKNSRYQNQFRIVDLHTVLLCPYFLKDQNFLSSIIFFSKFKRKQSFWFIYES
jgi:hypothetical protein